MKRLACGLLAGALAAPVFAQDDSPHWIIQAAFVCLDQDASYQSTPLGAALSKNPAYQHWRENEGEPVLACIAAKRLLPPGLCTGIFKMDPKGDPAAAKALQAQYADAIAHLDRIGECEEPPAPVK